MKTVYKYEFGNKSNTVIEMPQDSKIIRVGYQNSAYGRGLMIWAEVDTDKPKENIPFEWFNTGEEIPGGMQYVATLENNSGMITHLYKTPQP